MRKIAVIMAGGSGSRFWPISRKYFPKQLLHLYNDKSMLCNTVERVSGTVGIDNVYVSTGKDLIFQIQADLQGMIKDTNYIVEPEGKNTAPSVALCVSVLSKIYNEDFCVGFYPSDHLIQDSETFELDILNAYDVAEKKNGLVVIGIPPKDPNMGYGYIEEKEFDGWHLPIGDIDRRSSKVKRFHEKPNLETAQKYLKSTTHFWNSGILVGTNVSFLNEFHIWNPDIYQGMSEIFDNWNGYFRDDVVKKCFSEKFKSISIDKCILEKSENVFCVHGHFDWNDLGTFKSLEDVKSPDIADNVSIGNVKIANSAKNMILNWEKDSLVATYGVHDLIVINSGNVVLVCHKDQESRIKEILETIDTKYH